MSVKDDIQTIASEINRKARENFTGQIDLHIEMNTGGLTKISINIAKNLKSSQNMSKSNENRHF